MIREFIIKGVYLGNTKILPVIDRDIGVIIPQSLLFMCYACGEVYAKAPVSHEGWGAGIQGTWRPIVGLCTNPHCISHHSKVRGYGGLVPGSILHTHLGPLYRDSVPEAVLQYELSLHWPELCPTPSSPSQENSEKPSASMPSESSGLEPLSPSETPAPNTTILPSPQPPTQTTQ